MCVCSFLGQVVFGALMLTALGLTLVSMLTPGWQEVKNLSPNDTEDVKHIGILFCKDPGSDSHPSQSDSNYCETWWKKQPAEMKAVIACMCLAVIVEAAAIVWTIVTICACCCKQCLVHPLPALAFVASILLAIAVGMYGVKHKDSIVPPENATHTASGSISYSFYLACGGLAACIADIVVGVLTVTLAEYCL